MRYETRAGPSAEPAIPGADTRDGSGTCMALGGACPALCTL